MVYNLMTCSGFDSGFLGGCSMAWLGLVIVFFVLAFVRKGVEDFLGMDFTFPWSIICGVAGYIILVTITGAFKWGFLFGLIAGIAGGFLLAPIFGGGGESE